MDNDSGQRRKAYSVTQVNKYIKAVFDEDYLLENIAVEGELSNFKYHVSGHLYFTLKDEESVIKCVMFRQEAQSIDFVPKDGEKVSARGSVSVYVKGGAYQLYVRAMERAGIGGLFVEFEKLKRKLTAAGLFDQVHKKPLPDKIRKVAVITSGSGAALSDIVSVAARRNPLVSLYVYPVMVQGDLAADDIVSALKSANRVGCYDALILARGGGSIEDLWAFNNENVAYSVFESKIPVVTGIGHETDFTIADFAADIRAATPSAAAEIVVSPVIDEFSVVFAAVDSINKSAARIVDNYDAILRGSISKSLIRMFERRLDYYESTVSGSLSKASILAEKTVNQKYDRLMAALSVLEAVSPVSVLKRGFSITRDGGGSSIKSAGDVSVGDTITTVFFDGTVRSEVLHTTDELINGTPSF